MQGRTQVAIVSFHFVELCGRRDKLFGVSVHYMHPSVQDTCMHIWCQQLLLTISYQALHSLNQRRKDS